MQDIHSSVLPGKTERTPWQYIQVYKYRWAGRLCWSLTARAWRDYKPLEARRLRLIYCLGEGGGEEFCCDKGALALSPLKAYSVVLTPSPHIGGERFHDPPSSIPATTKSQCNYMQASDTYINTHVLWTLNNNFTYLVIWCELNCLRTVKGNSSHPHRWKQIHCRSRPPHRRIPLHILHPLIPRHFHLWHLTISLCSQTLWCVGNNDIE